jgi:DNA replicative helicase MCM subunit Mcm2 (Cdc46/Mcm family)
LDPYVILGDSSSYIDQQRLKLQETPESVPTGEMPRSLSVSVEKYLVSKVKPGSRVTIVGIYTTYQVCVCPVCWLVRISVCLFVFLSFPLCPLLFPLF